MLGAVNPQRIIALAVVNGFALALLALHAALFLLSVVLSGCLVINLPPQPTDHNELLAQEQSYLTSQNSLQDSFLSAITKTACPLFLLKR